MRAITICVDYWDYLAICLPYNERHFDEILIVTSPQDYSTQSLCRKLCIPYYVTNAFYDKGAMFNKWAALEEGLDYFGRHGWITILDADIIIPKQVRLPNLRKDCLYGPERYMGDNPLPEDRWKELPVWHNKEFSGFFQMFHASSVYLPNPPWHQTNWIHAGGADTFFQQLWPADKRIRLPFRVLHIGPNGRNWCGRVTPINGTVPEQASIRQEKIRLMMQARRSNPDPNYTQEKLP